MEMEMRQLYPKLEVQRWPQQELEHVVAYLLIP